MRRGTEIRRGRSVRELGSHLAPGHTVQRLQGGPGEGLGEAQELWQLHGALFPITCLSLHPKTLLLPLLKELAA